LGILGELLDGLGIDQVTLVGNSLGGLFALWFAFDCPSRVARAVVVGQPAVALAGARGDLIMAMVSAPVLGPIATWGMRLPTPRLPFRWMVRGAFGAHAARSVSNDIIDIHLLSARVPGQAVSFRSLQRRLTAGRTPRPEHQLTDAELRSFTVPLLFVWGEDDAFLSPGSGKPSVDKIPTARFVTMPGGHFPWYDDPDLCASLVAEGL
jgi:pimeloyl-ACP methyl ester carboxylesterase